eukprot:PLAT8298.1.p1 GENE.PLAT8298.1~~PLAT8298.1.p1  ORF type:complete len:1034 (+),score=530.21 PLAT8298.1:39-3104(+)
MAEEASAVVIGIRREDKNKWERRVPLTPDAVATLVGRGLRVLVQPSGNRAFPDSAYVEAGATMSEDLSEAGTILAVKEVPIDLLLEDKTYIFFSHVIKAQPYNMPLLDAMLEKRVRQIDYECIRTEGDRSKPRLVAFGRYAGIAGAFDFLRGVGERLLARGYYTPFLNLGSSYMYLSMEASFDALRAVGERIARYGLPDATVPLIAAFTGRGNVSKGAQEVFHLLPHKYVTAEELPALVADPPAEASKTVYLLQVTDENMVERTDGGAFDRDDYRASPEHYKPIFHTRIAPYITLLLHCSYWDARFPRLLTIEQTQELVAAGWRCEGICDISCDEAGGLEFTRIFTHIEAPFRVYDAEADSFSEDLDSKGFLYHAVDHLPSELAPEASQHFSDKLMPFVEAIARSDPTLPFDEQDDLPVEIRNAVICSHGTLTPDYTYIAQMRAVKERERGREADVAGAVDGSPVLMRRSSSFNTYRLVGHLFDSGAINGILDVIEDSGCKYSIVDVSVGQNRDSPTEVLLQIVAPEEGELAAAVESVATLAAKHDVKVTSTGSGEALEVMLSSKVTNPVLLIGSGFVAAPIVDVLLRRPENSVTVASFLLPEAEALVEGRPRARALYLDITKDEEKLDKLVSEHVLVLSMIPAPFHPIIARACLRHDRHLVTASYTSDEMRSFDEEAKAKGLVLLNEVGLDPGIDHMSAMRVIDDVRDAGGKLFSFSSLCGGLPAPEAADNPFGYKFSWSPRGVLTAARNASRFRRDGKVVEHGGEDLLKLAEPVSLTPGFALEVIPNRDSIPYADLYGIPEVETMFRGTLRFTGFCQLMGCFRTMGFLSEEAEDALTGDAVAGRLLMQYILGVAAIDAEPAETAALLAALDGVAGDDAALAKRLKEAVSWLGLLGDELVKLRGNRLDTFATLLGSKKGMLYAEGERDLVLMHHEFGVERADGARELHRSTLVQYTDEHGATAMSRTVGLTAGFAAQLILDGAVEERGVVVPLTKEWYDPILDQLEGEGVIFKEEVRPLL